MERGAIVGSRPRFRDAPRSHLLLLGVMAGVYVAVSLYLSYLRVLEFTVSNWDLGIFQQALWTTPHGYLFFEVGDWETWTTVSFLQIHPAPILFALVPIYAGAPSAITLLVVQSVAVGLAAFPLYQIGRVILSDSRRALGVAALYLSFAPVLTANLYDFHLEAFLPLEFFLLFLYWRTERYAWGAIVAVAAFLTLEVTPFMVAAVGLYFLVDPAAFRAIPSDGAEARGSERWGRRTVGRILQYLSTRPARWSLTLIVLSAVAYGALRAFEWWVLPGLLGVAPQPPAGGSGLVGAAAASGLGLDFAFGSNLGVKFGFWGLLLALLGFLPFLSPRALLLGSPWYFFTLQSNHLAWVQLGYQYGFLAAFPLVLAAVPGLRRFEMSVLPRLRRVAARLRRVGVPPPARRPSSRWVPVAGATMLVVLVASNVYLTPVNPHMQNLNSALSGYRVSYSPQPGYADVARAAALIPSNALVLSSDNLFPFVANDAQAYSLLWIPQQPNYLPFDPAHLPTFAFISSKEQFAEPSWLFIATSNRTLYGLIAVVTGTPGGTVRLWERGYVGPTQLSVAEVPTAPVAAPPIGPGWEAALVGPWDWPWVPLRSSFLHSSTTLLSW